jgi:hypothetical protein
MKSGGEGIDIHPCLFSRIDIRECISHENDILRREVYLF